MMYTSYSIRINTKVRIQIKALLIAYKIESCKCHDELEAGGCQVVAPPTLNRVKVSHDVDGTLK